MGIIPQTVNNGLRPYGLVYEILQNTCPVDWIINTSKGKDGIDFTLGGYNFKGGTFIIEARYRTKVINEIINKWAPASNSGVIGITTTAPVIVPLFLTFCSPPRWVLDKENGALVVNFFSYAGIPESAYGGASVNWKNPSQLDECDDLFVMPHTEATWSTHGNLYDWVRGTSNALGNKGALWLGCIGGSALMDMFNNVTPDINQQTNFLADKSGPAADSETYTENALLLWSNHGNSSSPLSYDYSGEPVMQFMGTTDAAQSNGSEQIYIPFGGAEGWFKTTHPAVYDPNQPERYNLSDKVSYRAATIVYGPAMGNTANGDVMMESGHNIGGTAPANIAAQRAFFNFSFMTNWGKTVVPSIQNWQDTIISGISYPLNYTIQANDARAITTTFATRWSSNCRGKWYPDSTSITPTFTPAAVSVPMLCNITVQITDDCGRKSFDTRSSILLPCRLSITNTITNPICENDINGSIELKISGGKTPFSYSITQITPVKITKTGIGSSLTGLAEGTYTYTISSSDGCLSGVSDTIIIQPEYLVPDKPLCGNVIQPTCELATGGITLTGLPKTGKWTITSLSDGKTTSGTGTGTTISGIAPGHYSFNVTNFGGCTSPPTENLTVNNPPASSGIAIAGLITNPDCLISTGSVVLSGLPATGNWIAKMSPGDITTTGTGEKTTISGLSSGTYTFKITNYAGCTSQTPEDIVIDNIPDCIPIANNDSASGLADKPLTGNVSANDIPVSDLVTTWTLTRTSGKALNGMVTMDKSGEYIYTPDLEFIGSDTFEYLICSQGATAKCSKGTVSINITKDTDCPVYVPNSFSPNGDGVHDNFKIKCIYNFENPSIEIYNRWGNLIFRKNHYGDIDFWGSEADAWWDGHSESNMNIGNQQLPTGTYYYLLKLDKNNVLRGFLFLNR